MGWHRIVWKLVTQPGGDLAEVGIAGAQNVAFRRNQNCRRVLVVVIVVVDRRDGCPLFFVLPPREKIVLQVVLDVKILQEIRLLIPSFFTLQTVTYSPVKPKS